MYPQFIKSRTLETLTWVLDYRSISPDTNGHEVLKKEMLKIIPEIERPLIEATHKHLELLI